VDSVQKRCPFYGFRWPDRQSKLVQIGGNECGLDIEGNGPCKMEAEGREVNFCLCEVADAARMYLELGGHRIRFCSADSSEEIALEEWTDQVMGWRQPTPL
jgi:hypothetical protein